MKIINRKTFLALPAGTVFSKYETGAFGPLTIKCSSDYGNDFLVQYIADAIKCTGSEDFVGRLDASEATGESMPMDFDCIGRDGCFEDWQLFAVWERADVEALIARLTKTLQEAA